MRNNSKYTFSKEAFPPGSVPLDFDGERLLWLEMLESGMLALKQLEIQTADVSSYYVSTDKITHAKFW
jgi:hypothetical protein